MKRLYPWKRARSGLRRIWARLTRRQRWMILALGLANGIVLLALLLFLMRTPPSAGVTADALPLAPAQLERCRQAIGRALLSKGESGIVQTQSKGKILLQLQLPLYSPTSSTSLRSEADAAVWAALEAVAAAGRGSCLNFDSVEVIVDLQAGDRRPLRATARASLPDLILWSLGEIDDAELTSRLHYQPPAVTTPPPQALP